MVPGRRNAKILGPRDRKWRKDGGGARAFKMAVAGWLTGTPRWRPLRGKRGRESSPPRFSQCQESSRSVSVRNCFTPFLHLFPSCPGPARLPRGRQAPLPGSSSSRFGCPGSRTGGSWSRGRCGFQQLSCSSPESVSAASCLCSLTGCFRFDVFLYLESGSTVAMVSAVAAAVAFLGGSGLRPTAASSVLWPDFPVVSAFRQKIVCAD